MLCRRLLPLLLLACVLPLQAQVYKWVDENGQKHFSNQPPATQPVEEVNVKHGYVSDGVPAPAPAAASSETQTTDTASASDSADTMCSEAIRWTGEDLPNLKDIARQRKQDGKLTSAQYDQAVQSLDQVKSQITLQDCLASKGKDREQYECLAGGAGVLVCSGALAGALSK